jgi:hypothetical protein
MFSARDILQPSFIKGGGRKAGGFKNSSNIMFITKPDIDINKIPLSLTRLPPMGTDAQVSRLHGCRRATFNKGGITISELHDSSKTGGDRLKQFYTDGHRYTRILKDRIILKISVFITFYPCLSVSNS